MIQCRKCLQYLDESVMVYKNTYPTNVCKECHAKEVKEKISTPISKAML
jgi:hypothetical protein